MTGATHIIVSAAICRLGIFNKSALPAIAFASHFLLDALPHHGMSRTRNYVLSAVTGTCLCYTGWRKKEYFPLWVAFFGILPDIIDKLGLSSTFGKMHDFFYFKEPAPKTFLLLELLVSALLLIYITF